MARLDELLARLKELRGSDLHLASGVGSAPAPARRAACEAEGWGALEDADARELMREIVDAEQWQEFETQRDLDFAYALPSVGRFRANYYLQQNGAAAVFRLIPETILSARGAGPAGGDRIARPTSRRAWCW